MQFIKDSMLPVVWDVCSSASPTICFSSNLTYFVSPHTRGLCSTVSISSQRVLLKFPIKWKSSFCSPPPLLSGAAGNIRIEGTTESLVMHRTVRLPHAGGGVPMQEAPVASLFPEDGALLIWPDLAVSTHVLSCTQGYKGYQGLPGLPGKRGLPVSLITWQCDAY